MSGERMEKEEGVVQWDSFMPRRVLRVLLIEADDSTRQIIKGLLQKCCYNVVAVDDGLKAWELLKGRPQSIDLILTEVELPSISGIALLTLIEEHEVCKKIPVIMMSAHDSANTVYRCMVKGAADFLVKPIRINELKNMWQHVWRRHASSKDGPQATNDAQQRVEGTAENDAASDHSSDYEEYIPRNRECIEKGSDAQSSYTRPDLETGEAKKSEQMLIHDGSVAVPNNLDTNSALSRDNIAAEAQQNCAVNALRETIDLIGTLEKKPECSYSSFGSTYTRNEVASSSLLDLNLGWSQSCGSVNQVNDRHTLKQSNASAFKQYIRRSIQPLPSTSASTSRSANMSSLTSDQIGRGIQLPCGRQRVLPVRVPVRCLDLDRIYSGSAGNVTQDGSTHHSTPREAALTRFRMKRKERCFDKKVRYENRKKHAEQRTRVKGQFASQLHTDNPN